MGARTRVQAADTRSDAELAVEAAEGNAGAFDALYRRHADTAWRVAYAVTSNPDDAADAVADAFTRVLQALPAGRLADATLFRSYLLAATRNAAIDSSRRGGRLQHTDRMEHLDVPAAVVSTPGDRLAKDVDASLVAEAFRSLPERWRSVLWLTEVEGIPPRDAAALLGVTPNNAAQLAVRARAGLRERFVQAHLRGSRPADGDCRFCVERLGAYVTGRLAPRDLAKVDQHLAGCAACRRRHEQLEDVGGSLRRIALPLPLLLGPAALAKWKLASATSVADIAPEAATHSVTAGAGGRNWNDLAAALQKPLLAATTGIFALGVISASVLGSPRRALDGPAAQRAPLSVPVASAPPVVPPQVIELASSHGQRPDGLGPDRFPLLVQTDDAVVPGTDGNGLAAGPVAPSLPVGLNRPTNAPPSTDPPGDGGGNGGGSGSDAAIEVGVAGRAGPADGGLVVGDQCQGGSLGGQSMGCAPPAAEADTVGVTVVTDGSGPLADQKSTIGL